MCCLMDSDQGSAPSTAFLSLVSLWMSTPIDLAVSRRWIMYEGVQAIAVTPRSWMSSTCLSVLPVLAGRTVAPTFSAP